MIEHEDGPTEVQRFPYPMLTSTKKHPSWTRHEKTTRQADNLRDQFIAAVYCHHSPEGSVHFNPQRPGDDVSTLGRIHVSRNQWEEIGWSCLLLVLVNHLNKFVLPIPINLSFVVLEVLISKGRCFLRGRSERPTKLLSLMAYRSWRLGYLIPRDLLAK